MTPKPVCSTRSLRVVALLMHCDAACGAQGLGDGPQLLHAQRMQRQGCLGECAGKYTQYCCWGGHAAKTLHRKRPVKVEPKVFFANERTFLSWMHMSVLTGSIGAAMLGLVHGPGDGGARRSNAVVVRHVGDHAEAIGKLMVLVGISMGIYALITFCALASLGLAFIVDEYPAPAVLALTIRAYMRVCLPCVQIGARERYACALAARSRTMLGLRSCASY